MRDVAQVRDGNAPQTNIVHVDGTASVVMHGTQEWHGVDARHRRRHQGQAGRDQGQRCPPTCTFPLIDDQSLFVSGGDRGVAHEGAIAAALTSVMILLFLGSWRSTVIIAISIPLAMLGSIICCPRSARPSIS